MNNGVIEVDKTKINRLMDDLSFTKAEAKRALKGGLRESAKVIQKQAKINLKAVRNQASGTTLKAQNLVQFVRIAVYKSGTGARIDIMDDKRKSTYKRLAKKGKDNKSFILKFFATGTDDRYTKSHTKAGYGRRTERSGRGGFRGRIGKSNFFKLAVDSKQKEAERMLSNSIIEQINKIVKRRK
jgi:hypothetical protein